MLIILLPLQAQVTAFKNPKITLAEKKRVFLVTATCYYPTGQLTADGSKIDSLNPLKHRWIAISRDLKFKFGDTVMIKGVGIYDGYWIIKDKMNKRFKNRIDLLTGRDNKIGRWDKITLKTN